MTIETLKPIVAIPAHNEEERLPALFEALASQSWLLANTARLPVIVVLNNCIDYSHNVTLAAAAKYSRLAIQPLDVTFSARDAHVGTARRLAMETALAGCSERAQTVILTTDADATPLADWIANNLRHITDGIDLVGGLIVGNPAEEQKLGLEFNFRARLHHLYSQAIDYLTALTDPLPHDPWPRHHDHTGASLAIRADVYAAVGGLPALPLREDIALVERVRQAGYLIRHPLDVVVEVSARLRGRAPGGMADCLATWMREAAAGKPLLVEHPGHLFRKRDLSRNTVQVFEHAAATVAANEGQGAIPAQEALKLLAVMIADAGGKLHVGG